MNYCWSKSPENFKAGMLRLPQEKKEFPGKVDKYRHMEQPLKVICFDGLFHNAQQLIRF